MVYGRARPGSGGGAGPEPRSAVVLRVPPLGLWDHAHRQISLLRHAGAGGRSDLGILRNPEPRAHRFLLTRRLRHGDVSDAADRRARRVWQSRLAGFHGLSELDVSALVLAWLQPLRD